MSEIDSLFSKRVERHVLSGLIKYPDQYLDYHKILNDSCFCNATHNSIFRVISSILDNRNSLDSTVLGQQVKDKFRTLSISIDDDVDIFDYILSLEKTSITKNGLKDAVFELLKKKIQRDLYNTSSKLKEISLQCSLEPKEIIRKAEKEFSDNLNVIISNDDPEKPFETIVNKIEELGNNPLEEMGVKTSFPVFNARYGGLVEGLYVFVARPKTGKSLLVNSLGLSTSKLNGGLKVLCCDTEMSTEVSSMRLASAVTGIPFWALKTGNYRRSQQYIDMWEKRKHHLDRLQNIYFHKPVPGVPIDDVLSMMKKWYYREVGTGNKCVIIYDYLKLTGEDGGSDKKEWQIIGEKVTKLQDFSLSINNPILTACQLNREDGVSQSDRISWFSSGVWSLQKKTPEEKEDDGEENGTHKLTEMFTRFQGKDAGNFDGYVRVHKGTNRKGDPIYETKSDYINLELKNFKVEEKGCLKDLIDSKDDVIDFGEDKDNGVPPI